MLKDRMAQIPNVLRDPALEAEILQFTPAGPVLAVRPYTHNANYWQVYFDTNRLIREAFGEAGFTIPEQHIFVGVPEPKSKRLVFGASAKAARW